MADSPPIEIPYECAKDQIYNQVLYFPEFQNYQIYKGNLEPEKNTSALDAFRYVGNGMGSMANYLGQKYMEYDMNTKLVNGGAATLKGLATVGKFLYKITKPVVKYASIRAIQGVGYLCKVAEEQMNDIDENENEEDEKETPEKDTKNKKNKKEKKTKKINKNDNKNEDTKNTIKNSYSSDNSNISNTTEDENLKASCDFPSLGSIIAASNNNNNNNNIYPNQNNNYNGYPNQNNNFYPNPNQNIININISPNFVVPVGLESSSHENSIVGEKKI